MLAEDDDKSIYQRVTRVECPKIMIEIADSLARALLETDSKITGVSRKLYKNNLVKWKGCTKLPVIGLQEMEIMGEKSIQTQLRASVIIKIIQEELNFVVMPKLVSK